MPSSAALPVGTYVLYRDADAFLAGLPDHTRIGRVIHDAANAWNRSTIEFVGTSEVLRSISLEYLRVIPAAEIMADIDTAPLATLTDAGPLSAAMAWLRNGRSTPAITA